MLVPGSVARFLRETRTGESVRKAFPGDVRHPAPHVRSPGDGCPHHRPPLPRHDHHHHRLGQARAVVACGHGGRPGAGPVPPRSHLTPLRPRRVRLAQPPSAARRPPAPRAILTPASAVHRWACRSPPAIDPPTPTAHVSRGAPPLITSRGGPNSPARVPGRLRARRTCHGLRASAAFGLPCRARPTSQHHGLSTGHWPSRPVPSRARQTPCPLPSALCPLPSLPHVKSRPGDLDIQ